jgi:Ca-activated chloride channel family protein
MFRRARSLVLALAAAATTPWLISAQPIFRTDTQAVPLYVTVTDQNGRLVPGLTRDDFTVLDNGAPQDLSVFDNNPRPFSVVVMLDTSLSMTLSMDYLKQAAEEFLMRLTPEDRAMVGAFNDKIQFATEMTDDRDALIGSLNDLMFGNPTRLFDAVDRSIDQLRPVEGRRVVLLFTDGEDTASKLGAGEVIERARAEEVMIYSIWQETIMTVGGIQQRTRPERGLRKMSDETGGGYFELKKTGNLGATFTRVAEELRAQYVLGFSPAKLDGKIHKLDVRVKTAGLTARARKSYLAVAPKTAG